MKTQLSYLTLIINFLNLIQPKQTKDFINYSIKIEIEKILLLIYLIIVINLKRNLGLLLNKNHNHKVIL